MRSTSAGQARASARSARSPVALDDLSVIAAGAGRLLRIPGEAFVAAVNGSSLGSGGSATAGIVGRVANPVEVAEGDTAPT